jgi:hypothetical protein
MLVDPTCEIEMPPGQHCMHARGAASLIQIASTGNTEHFEEHITTVDLIFCICRSSNVSNTLV